MAQEVSGVPGVLCRHDIHASQDFDGARGNVSEVSDGCGDEVEHGRVRRVTGEEATASVKHARRKEGSVKWQPSFCRPLPAFAQVAGYLDCSIFHGLRDGLALISVDVCGADIDSIRNCWIADAYKEAGFAAEVFRKKRFS